MKLLVLAGQLPAKFAVRKVTLPCAEPSIAKIRFHSSVYQTHIPQRRWWSRRKLPRTTQA